MQIDSSNNSNKKDLSKSMKIKKEDIICKDGFCTLPSKRQNTTMIENNLNLFDPV